MVSKDEVKEIQAYLDQYDWFHVREEKDGELIREFYASGVEILDDNFVCFKRLFAVGLYINNSLSYIKKKMFSDINVQFVCKEYIYLIKPLHRKTLNAKKCNLNGNFMLDDLMNPCFLTKKKTEQQFIFLLDPEKIGKLDFEQYCRISLLIDFYMGGRNVEYQCCRIPAFSVKKNNKTTVVYAHIYNLETGKCLNTVKLYDSSLDICLLGE